MERAFAANVLNGQGTSADGRGSRAYCGHRAVPPVFASQTRVSVLVVSLIGGFNGHIEVHVSTRYSTFHSSFLEAKSSYLHSYRVMYETDGSQGLQLACSVSSGSSSDKTSSGSSAADTQPNRSSAGTAQSHPGIDFIVEEPPAATDGAAGVTMAWELAFRAMYFVARWRLRRQKEHHVGQGFCILKRRPCRSWRPVSDNLPLLDAGGTLGRRKGSGAASSGTHPPTPGRCAARRWS